MAPETTQLQTEPLPPGPGRYPGVLMAEYKTWPYMNASTLVEAFPEGDRQAMSMARLKAAIDGRLGGPTRAMRLGTANHMRLLEPANFSAHYKVAQPCAATIQSKQSKNYGKPCGNVGETMYVDEEGTWFCRIHPPPGASPAEDFLDPATAATIEEIVGDLQHRKVIQLLKAFGGTEVSYVWDQVVPYSINGQQHERTMRMKLRIDKDLTNLPQKHPKLHPLFVDLKKVRRDAWTNRATLRAIHQYCYDLKAALYLDGAKAVDGIEREWVWVFLEDAPPYHTNPVQASAEMIAVGRAWYKKVLSEYVRCLHLSEQDEAFVWPVAHEGIHYSRDPWWEAPQ